MKTKKGISYSFFENIFLCHRQKNRSWFFGGDTISMQKKHSFRLVVFSERFHDWERSYRGLKKTQKKNIFFLDFVTATRASFKGLGCIYNKSEFISPYKLVKTRIKTSFDWGNGLIFGKKILEDLLFLQRNIFFEFEILSFLEIRLMQTGSKNFFWPEQDFAESEKNLAPSLHQSNFQKTENFELKKNVPPKKG